MQCFILLLRPLFLQEISALFLLQKASRCPPSILQPTESLLPEWNAGAMPLKLQCLDAARKNARILIDLWTIGKIGKSRMVAVIQRPEELTNTLRSQIWILGITASVLQPRHSVAVTCSHYA